MLTMRLQNQTRTENINDSYGGDAGPLSQRTRAGSERLHLGRSDAACVYLGKDTTETFVTQGLAVGSLIALAW